MSKLDDDNVVGLNGVDNVGETSLNSVGARAAATDGLVDNRKRQRVREINTPPCCVLDACKKLRWEKKSTLKGTRATTGLCHRRISSKIDSRRTFLNAAARSTEGCGGQCEQRNNGRRT